MNYIPWPLKRSHDPLIPSILNVLGSKAIGIRGRKLTNSIVTFAALTMHATLKFGQ